MKSTISLSYDKYSPEDLLSADFALSQKDLINYSKAIPNRIQRISNIRKLYSGNDFNTPIYELAFKALLSEKKNYKKDFVVPFEIPLEQDLVLTPNSKVRLISFNRVENVYNTKNLKSENIFVDYGSGIKRIVSLYISKDGHFGFLIRFNRYGYERDFGGEDKNIPINDGEFKGEAYESTLVNLIMFFSSIIKNNETNIIDTIERISIDNPSSTIAHVYRKTKDNIDNIDKIDSEFSDALLNSDVGKASKIDYIDNIKNYFTEDVLPIKFIDESGTKPENKYASKYPIATYEISSKESEDEFNFSLRYESANKATFSNLALLVPVVIRIKNNKLYLLYSANSDGTIPSPDFTYSSNDYKIENDSIFVNNKSYDLLEKENYFSLLKRAVHDETIANKLIPRDNVSFYSNKFDNLHKFISLNFISYLKTSKRKLSLIENKLTPYEYKLKIINVLSDILVKAFTSEILIKKI